VNAAAPTRAIGDRPAALLRPLTIAAALGGLVEARALAATSGRIDGLVVGIAFGLGLIGIALLTAAPRGSGRPLVRSKPRPRVPVANLGIGVSGGLLIVGLTVIGRVGIPGPTVFPLGDLGPWAAVTAMVAIGEEAVLRGVLFDSLARHSGPLAAIVITSAVFALIHVPLYGWHVLLLDLGVGLVLGGLRVATGGIAAPAAAHVIADLATQWL
jgi:membrane protease YdiL (CAAX protease family)